MFPPPPLFCFLVFTNSYAGMWLKIPGIVESSHMRKERKTQCYLTLINVKKTVTCSFCLFFGRLSCELLHYNCSFQRIKKVRFEIHLKGSAQWCELPNRKKKENQYFVLKQIQSTEFYKCLVPMPGATWHIDQPSPHTGYWSWDEQEHRKAQLQENLSLWLPWAISGMQGFPQKF